MYIYVIFEDCGIPEGLDLRAVCSSLEYAQSISGGQEWKEDGIGWTWGAETVQYGGGPFFIGPSRIDHRFYIQRYEINDLDEVWQ